jgi:hypothetical protein
MRELKPLEEKPCIKSLFFIFFFILLKIKAEKQQKYATHEKKNLVQACKVRANLTSRREVYLYQDRKAAARHTFSVIPMKYLHNFLKTTR